MGQKPLASISCLSCTLSGLSHNIYVFEVSIKWFFITLRALKCNIDFGKMTSEITWFKQESYSFGIAITYQNELECSRIWKICDSICPSEWYQMPNFVVWAHGLCDKERNQQHCLTAIMWAPRGEGNAEDRRSHVNKSSRRRNRLEDEEHGMRCGPKPSTEQRGDRVWRPYDPYASPRSGQITGWQDMFPIAWCSWA